MKDEANAKESHKVDKGSNEGNNSNHFRDCEDVERCRGSDLLTPPLKKEVCDIEEDTEENCVY
jgi:hypothetical protein